MPHRQSFAVLLLSVALAPGATRAEDTVGRPQAVGFSGGSNLVRVDDDGSFSIQPSERTVVSLVALNPGARIVRGRDGEPCATDGLVITCDRNGNGFWNGNAGGDLGTSFAVGAGAGWIAYHDVDGDGVRQLVKYVADFGGRDEFRIDANQNDRWDGVAGGDALWLVAPDLGPGTPFVCACGGSDAGRVGKVLADGSTLAIDLDGDGVWSGPGGGDALISFSPESGPGTFLFADLEAAPGDEIVKYVPEFDGRDRHLVDANGNLAWDGTAGGDAWRLVASGGTPGEPCAIDPGGDGTSVLCKHDALGQLFVDLDGDGVWSGNAGGDLAAFFRPDLVGDRADVFDRAP